MELTKLERLAELRIEQRRIEAEIEKLVPEVSEQVQNDGIPDGTKLKVSSGVFSVTYLRTWKFPAKLLAEEKALKEKKDEAKQTGEATYTEKASLKFIENKEE